MIIPPERTRAELAGANQPTEAPRDVNAEWAKKFGLPQTEQISNGHAVSRPEEAHQNDIEKPTTLFGLCQTEQKRHGFRITIGGKKIEEKIKRIMYHGLNLTPCHRSVLDYDDFVGSKQTKSYVCKKKYTVETALGERISQYCTLDTVRRRTKPYVLYTGLGERISQSCKTDSTRAKPLTHRQTVFPRDTSMAKGYGPPSIKDKITRRTRPA